MGQGRDDRPESDDRRDAGRRQDSSAPAGRPALDLDDPVAAMAAIGEAALRLLAGSVPRATMEQLRRTLRQSSEQYPWREVVATLLAAPVDPERLAKQGLAAQRDWILRGGRETPRRSAARMAKGLLARLLAQIVFGLSYALVIVVALLLLKLKLPEVDIYRLLDWVQARLPG